MTPKAYETFRNELIELLQNAIALDAVSTETRNMLIRICKRTLESQFDIVIVGEFQGGKSTTFNTFCDGRELSPIGSGTKTSGCIISAQNIADPDEPEAAYVEWRTPDELIAGFSDLLLPHLEHLVPERFQHITAAELGSKINIENEADRSLIAKAITLERGIWEKDKAGYDRQQVGKLDVLRAANIIAHHYTNPELIRLRQQHEFTLNEAGKLIVFPQHWEDRWEPESFEITEIIFVFIRHVRLKLRSQNLGRLGCVITDCPGLFASRWDTEIARSAMFHADAILYLFDGAKTMKLSDLKALHFVRQKKMAGKLFYACNIRGHSLENSKRILQSTVTMLRDNGFNVSDDEFTLFHALLALRSVQAVGWIKRQRIHQYSKDETVDSLSLNPPYEINSRGETADSLSLNPPYEINSRGETADSLPLNPPYEISTHSSAFLFKEMMRQLMILDIDHDHTELNPEMIQLARDASHLDQLMDMVEKNVVRKKAKKILIDNGAYKGIQCLDEAEKSLRNREVSAYETEKEFLIRVETADNTLKKFDETCKHAISKLDDDKADILLADDGWQFIENNKSSLCHYIAEKLSGEIIDMGMWNAAFGQEKLKDKINSIVRQAVESYFDTYTMTWIWHIKEGNNALYNKHMAEKIQAVDKEMKAEWKEIAASDVNLLAGITLPDFSGNLDIDSEIFSQHLDENQVVGDMIFSMVMAGGRIAGSLALGFAVSRWVIVPVVALIANPIGSAIVVIIASALWIYGTYKSSENVLQSVQEKMAAQISKKIEPILDESFQGTAPHIKNYFVNFIKDIRKLYKQGFSAAVNTPRMIFEKRRKQAEDDFKKSQQERETIAKTAKRIREEQIYPLRTSLQEFILKIERKV